MNKEIEKVPSLKELSDRGAIKYLLKRHSRGIDRLDLDCLLSSYWEDAQVDYGGFKGLAHDFARKVIPSLEKKYKLTQHKISNILITFNDQEAFSEAYVTAYHLYKEEEKEMTYIGRYIDRLRFKDSLWKISHRTAVMDWNNIRQVDQDLTGSFELLAKGSHFPEDPLYKK